MALLTPGLDYTDRDFTSLKLRLQGLLQTVFPDWTDFNIASFGNILVELFSFVGDVLNYYQDGQASESFWPTLTQRDAAIRLAELIDFPVTGASSATAVVALSTAAADTLPAPVPLGFRMQTSDPENPIPFRSTQAVTLAAGTTSIDIPVEQAEIRTEFFVSTDEPNQELILKYAPFLDYSIDTPVYSGSTLVQGVSAANGDYSRVANFLGAKSTDLVFTATRDQLDRAHIRFGDGRAGTIPQGEITVIYKIGGGLQGNVDVNRITVPLDPVYYSDSRAVTFRLANAAAASGGDDAMGLEEIRERAPASLRVLSRCVAREDFEDAALGTAGVARALMATSNEYTGIAENTGRLYIVAQGQKLSSGCIAPATPTAQMLSTVHTDIMTNTPPTVTFTFTTLSAVFKDITVSARLYLNYGASEVTVGAAIRVALADFFAVQLASGARNTRIDFGANILDFNGDPVKEIPWDDVYDVIKNTSGVRKVDEGIQGLLLNGVRSSVALTPIEFPRLSTITLYNADTGSAL